GAGARGPQHHHRVPRPGDPRTDADADPRRRAGGGREGHHRAHPHAPRVARRLGVLRGPGVSAPPAGAGEPLHLVVPGRLDQRTGGYLYDARIVAGLRALGRTVRVHELRGRFPDPDETARRNLAAALRAVPDGASVVVDGLAGGALPDVLRAEAARIHVVALVHHPLGDETGLDDAARARLLESERAGIRACRGVVVTSRFTAERLR